MPVSGDARSYSRARADARALRSLTTVQRLLGFLMIKAVRLTLALAALAAPAALAAGCGGVPGNAVAEVDGTAIEKSSFDHWINVAAKLERAGGRRPRCPSRRTTRSASPPSARRTPKPAKGQPKVTDAQLKTQCKQEYEQLRDQVLQLLISFQWIQGEAKEQGIKVTDAEVKKSFDEQKKQSFPKDADYQKFLKDSGQTEADICSSASSSTCCRTRSATRSSRARTRSPTPRSRTSTTRTRRASRSPSGATCASS